ncbi:MAG TPA: hypothetical protein VLQ79_03110 [Myxococcaceae bacterium]|nr:hypothetical protein [Myxococcaceae bacterium]
MRAPLIVLCLLAAQAEAQETTELGPPSVPRPGQTDWTRHRHLGGFFRMTLGGGYLGATPSPSGAASFSSGAATMSAAVGGALAEDWILAADAWVSAAPANRLGKDWTFGLSALGLNLTHYVMPANVFITFVPSVTLVTVSDRNGETVRQTQAGFGARFSLGKEWWVGDHWGIGLAVEGFFASNHERASAQPVWTTTGASLVFSATYN